jgi:hypothetical protein
VRMSVKCWTSASVLHKKGYVATRRTLGEYPHLILVCYSCFSTLCFRDVIGNLFSSQQHWWWRERKPIYQPAPFHIKCILLISFPHEQKIILTAWHLNLSAFRRSQPPPPPLEG